jgi:hypothetical protein
MERSPLYQGVRPPTLDVDRRGAALDEASPTLDEVGRLVRRARRARTRGDPVAELRQWAAADRLVAQVTAEAVERAFAAGLTEQQAADALGITQQAVSKRFGHLRRR